jgi:hypothetical protein
MAGASGAARPATTREGPLRQGHARNRQVFEGQAYVPLSRSGMSSLRRSGSPGQTPKDRSPDQPAVSAETLPVRLNGLRLGRQSPAETFTCAPRQEAVTNAVDSSWL